MRTPNIILYPRVSVIILYPSVSVIILYPQCQCHYPVPPVSVSLSCTPSVSVIILYPECQCHYPVPPESVSLSCTPSVSVIILYPQCQCHYPVPTSSQCHYPVPRVSQCHYPVPRVSVSLTCTPSVSVIILYPQCQCHYPVPPVSVSLSCTPSVSVIILYPECQCHYPVPPESVSLSCTPVSVSLSCTPSVSVIILYPQCYISVIKMHFGTNLPAGRFGGRTAHAPAILQDGGAQGEDGRTDTGTPDIRVLQDTAVDMDIQALCSSMDNLVALGLLYDEPNSVDQAEKNLLALCQGQDDVEVYCQKFRKWSVLTLWNESALAALFRKGLSEALKDVMVGFPMPAGLNESMSLAIQIGRRLRERKSVHHLAVLSESKPEPMQCDRTMTKVERQEHRRLNRLCFYCGDSTHAIYNCPKRTRRFDSSAVIGTVQSKFLLSITLMCSLSSYSVMAFVDSGAALNLMDMDYAKRCGFFLEPLRCPIPLRGIDATPLAKNKPQYWAQLTMCIAPAHQEVIRFLSFMHDIFREYLDKFLIVYLDDILIFSDDWESHVKQVEVDASEIGAGAVLSQRGSGCSVLKPCAFFSRKFSAAERNYDVGNRELLAMKWAFEEWRHWLEGAKHRVVVESSDCPGVDSVVDRLQQIWTQVVDNLTLSQEKAQLFANRRRR
ncbi:unnamed protein product, partial [Ranitomeya imitator]